MKRKDIFNLLQPLLDQFYQFSYALLPDELEAEQLVMDGVNGFIIKEKKWLTHLAEDDQARVRRAFFQKVISHIYEIGNKRVAHSKISDDQIFYQLPVRNRAIISLRYLMNYTPEQIEDFLGLAKWEVIEGIHNSRFSLMNELNTGTL